MKKIARAIGFWLLVAVGFITLSGLYAEMNGDSTLSAEARPE